MKEKVQETAVYVLIILLVMATLVDLEVSMDMVFKLIFQ